MYNGFFLAFFFTLRSYCIGSYKVASKEIPQPMWWFKLPFKQQTFFFNFKLPNPLFFSHIYITHSFDGSIAFLFLLLEEVLFLVPRLFYPPSPFIS